MLKKSAYVGGAAVLLLLLLFCLCVLYGWVLYVGDGREGFLYLFLDSY